MEHYILGDDMIKMVKSAGSEGVFRLNWVGKFGEFGDRVQVEFSRPDVEAIEFQVDPCHGFHPQVRPDHQSRPVHEKRIELALHELSRVGFDADIEFIGPVQLTRKGNFGNLIERLFSNFAGEIHENSLTTRRTCSVSDTYASHHIGAIGFGVSIQRSR